MCEDCITTCDVCGLAACVSKNNGDSVGCVAISNRDLSGCPQRGVVWCTHCLQAQVYAIEQVMRPLPEDLAPLIRSFLIRTELPAGKRTWYAAYQRAIAGRSRARREAGAAAMAAGEGAGAVRPPG